MGVRKREGRDRDVRYWLDEESCERDVGDRIVAMVERVGRYEQVEREVVHGDLIRLRC